MSRVKSMEELIRWANEVHLPPLKPNITNVRLKTDRKDHSAAQWIPSDCPVRNPFPIDSPGDGSCFLHSLSRVAFGYTSPARVAELRIRIVVEAIINRDWYLKHENIALGMAVEEVKSPVTELYADLSGAYNEQNTLEDMALIYNNIVFNYRLPTTVIICPHINNIFL